MKIKRNIESELLRWKNAENRKPVLLRGARQVGKTFVVNQFAENFENFIDVNLERPRERELFENFNTGRELVEFVYNAHGGTVRDQFIEGGGYETICQGCNAPFTLRTFVGKCPECGGVHAIAPPGDFVGDPRRSGHGCVVAAPSSGARRVTDPDH